MTRLESLMSDNALRMIYKEARTLKASYNIWPESLHRVASWYEHRRIMSQWSIWCYVMDWEDALRLLLKTTAPTNGRIARKTIENRYSVTANLPNFLPSYVIWPSKPSY
jgi:hypothetical protein